MTDITITGFTDDELAEFDDELEAIRSDLEERTEHDHELIQRAMSLQSDIRKAQQP